MKPTHLSEFEDPDTIECSLRPPVEDYFVYDFIDVCIEECPKSHVETIPTYGVYCFYCAVKKLRPMEKVDFERVMSDAGYDIRTSKPGFTCYVGVKLVEWPENYGLDKPPEWNGRSLPIPEDLRSKVEPIGFFLGSLKVTKVAGHKIAAWKLYEAYRRHCQSRFEKRMSKREFLEGMKEAGYECHVCEHGRKYFIGIALV